MILKDAVSGKIGTYILGPRQFLNTDIRLGELALCIAEDGTSSKSVFIWGIGGFKKMLDYLYQATAEGEISKEDLHFLLKALDEAKTKIPANCIDRLASLINISSEELVEFAKLAQVKITPPIEGVHDFSTGKGVLLLSNQSVQRANIH